MSYSITAYFSFYRRLQQTVTHRLSCSNSMNRALKHPHYKRETELKQNGARHELKGWWRHTPITRQKKQKRETETRAIMQSWSSDVSWDGCEHEGLPAGIVARFCLFVLLWLLLNRLKMAAQGYRLCQDHTKLHRDGGDGPGGDSWFIVQWSCWQMSPALHHLWSPQNGRRRHLRAWRLLWERQTPGDRWVTGYKTRLITLWRHASYVPLANFSTVSCHKKKSHPVFDSQVCVIVYVNFCHGNAALLFRHSLLQPWPKDFTGTTPPKKHTNTKQTRCLFTERQEYWVRPAEEDMTIN